MTSGILPVIVLADAPHARRRPSRIPPQDRLTWQLVVGLFGFLLALGSNTPLEHLFNRPAALRAPAAIWTAEHDHD